MKTGATNKRVRELITLVQDGTLIPRPEFQRRLVWTNRDKDRFLDTVLRSLPFPEIYLADGEVDLATGRGTQLLVDGLQRVMTLVHYFEGHPDLKLVSVQPYAFLSEDEKRNFLQYEVAVRDLGATTRDLLIDVFQRINATKYSLTDIEIHNALYNGALKRYAESVADSRLFTENGVFTPTDYKRMGDLRFALSLVITLLSGYFNRDDSFEEYLERFNDEFPLESEVRQRLPPVMDFVEECGFEPKSRAWKKADLFTLLVETDHCLHKDQLRLEPSTVVERLTEFYAAVDRSGASPNTPEGIYYKAALQASNDRSNRVRRGVIVHGLLRGQDEAAMMAALKKSGLV